MTDLKFNILKLLYNTHPQRNLSLGDIIDSLPDDKVLIYNALKELQSREIIENLPCSNFFKLTLSGAEVFEQIQEERTKESKQESQQRFDNKISVASLLIPFVTFILGLLVDHYTNIVSFVISLFK